MVRVRRLAVPAAVVLCCAALPAWAQEAPPPGAWEAGVAVDVVDHGNLTAIAARPSVSYWYDPAGAIELGVGWIRWDAGDADASNVWVRVGLRGHLRLGQAEILASLGVAVDPENDDYNSQDTLYALDFDLELRGWVTPVLYVLGGLTDTGVGAAIAYLPSSRVASDPGHGGTIRTFDDGDGGSTQLILLDLSVGVGLQLSPAARVEVSLPLVTFMAVADDEEDPDNAVVVFDDYYGVDVAGWVGLGAIELGGRLNYLSTAGNDDADDEAIVRAGVDVRARF
jgi:hypothetical protein